MPEITIYHNGMCSKSRGALEILMEKGIQHQVRWYLTDPLNKKELRALLKKLGIKASGLVRKSEALYKEKYEGKLITEQEWLTILKENPVLIERPIVEKGDKAIVARPPERIFELLDE
jgi:arsenate reductase (glutaredoxin)